MTAMFLSQRAGVISVKELDIYAHEKENLLQSLIG